MDLGTLALILIAAGAVGGLVAAVVLLIRRRSPESAARPVPAPIPERAGEPQFYIALNAESIFVMYDQTDPAAVLLSTTDTTSTAAELAANGGPVGGKVARNSGHQTQIDYLPVKSAARAASIIERRLEVTGRISSLDLKASTDEVPLTNLLTKLRADADGIGLTVPDDVVNGLRDAWKERNRPSTDTTLESLGEFVRVRAEFTIAPGAIQGDHLLKTEWGDPPDAVRVHIVCQADDLLRSFPREGSKITATCLGVRERGAEKDRLDLQLLSIYRS